MTTGGKKISLSHIVTLLSKSSSASELEMLQCRNARPSFRIIHSPSPPHPHHVAPPLVEPGHVWGPGTMLLRAIYSLRKCEPSGN